MIPVNLKMHNFMPYKGDAPLLSFRSIHTACISGDNGAGKSSIIDAITWSLWGKARSKSDDELVYQGENDTMVEFDFNAGDQLYRIIRKHSRSKSKKGSGQSSLDLFICNDGEYLSISAERMTQTQEKVEAILHMDYETFTNSAYLRQGHADEFTHQPPGKRKEVLANILGLSVYDIYEEQSKEKAREAEQAKMRLYSGIAELDDELALKPSLETDLNESEKILADIDLATEKTGCEVKQLRAEAQALENIKAQLSQIDSAITRHLGDIEREKEVFRNSTSRLAEYKNLLDNRSAIESGFQELKAAREKYDLLSQRSRQFSRLTEKYNQLEKICDRAQNDLNTLHKLAENDALQLERKCEKLPELKLEQRKIATALAELAPLENEIKARRDSVGAQKTALFNASESTLLLRSEIRTIDEKLGILLETKNEARCPLCETELGTRELDLVRSKYAAEKANKLDSIKQLECNSTRLSSEIKKNEADASALEATLKQESRNLVAQESRVAQAIKEGVEASARLADEKQEIAEIEATLASQDYAPTERKAIVEILAEIASLSYDEKEHDALQSRKENLAGWEEQKKNLDEALSLLNQENDNASRSKQIIDQVKTRLDSDTILQQEFSVKLKELPEISRRLSAAENELAKKLEEQRVSREKTAVLKERIKQLSELEKRNLEKRRELAEASVKENLYRQLTDIFGKKGLQAMLIETALPEIETEANRLLARMTDGRMNLTFEPQKTTKKGDISETLDIKIADELGTRNYEMFSGGEAFRIDFSIRIALARLLAKRAGAPLPTLIIDEGFGTQDADGIEKLKEAINSVQDDFQKILVITHIDELKDAFPARIDVVKKNEGSTVEISQ